MNFSTPGFPVLHYLLEFAQIMNTEDNEGQGGLVCCSPWGCKESDSSKAKPQCSFFKRNLPLTLPICWKYVPSEVFWSLHYWLHRYVLAVVYQSRGLKQHEFIFSQSRGWKSNFMVPVGSVSIEGSLRGVQTVFCEVWGLLLFLSGQQP